ncbi:lipocalin family protein [Empedobacter stercoris]|uniref:lipocalin family protein n=1 Tax=Empedobacter stercoris TaxID=1628248 RepID=UPI0039ED5A7D
MKKFILPSIFAFGLLFSCNNDDDDSSTDNASIVGTWNYVKHQTQFSKDNKIVDEENDGCEEKNTYTFSKENKYIILNHELYQNQCNPFTEEAIYKVEGKKLFIDWGEGSQEAEIIKLTKNELILRGDYGEDLDEDGKSEIEILHLKR